MNRNCVSPGLFGWILFWVVCLLPWGATFADFDPVNDDTDVFMANPSVTSDRPNVLIILDNTANWNQPFDNEKAALVSVVANMNDYFNLGLMMFPETGGSNDNVDGGYVRFAMRQMTTTNKTVLSDMVNNLDEGDDKSNNATSGLAMYEAYLYFGGLASRASFGKIKTDYADNDANNPASANDLGSYALTTHTADSLYNSPIATGCQKNFIIYISNGPANENANARTVSEDKLATLTNSTPPATIAISPNGQQGNWADEWANYLASADVNSSFAGKQSVYTYVVEVDAQTTGQGEDMTALLKSMANKGQGRYFSVSSGNSGQAIINALNEIFQEIQAVNSVFAATTLPVSVNVRGTNLNQVYVGMFRPDALKKPRWYGNLKCYQLGYDNATSDLYLADRNGVKAENTTTGFLNPDAISHWTASSDFWNFRDSTENGAGGSSDMPDGDLVEKGGVGQKQRVDLATTQAARNLYTCTGTCTGGSALSSYPFMTTNTDITSASLLLNVQAVSSLSGLAEQTVSALTDVKPVVSLSTAAGGVNVTSMSNGSVTQSISALTTTKTHTITNLTNASVSQSVSLLQKSGNKVAATLNGHGYSTGNLVTISSACNSQYNGTFSIVEVDVNNFTYGSLTGNPTNCTTATATTTSSLVTATVTGHGFISGQSVTIAGVTPAGFNGPYTITVQDANTFRFSSASALGVPTVFGTVEGQTSTATATLTGHGYNVSDVITISGATPTGYNGNVTILTKPDANTFTYAVSPMDNATGTLTATKGSTTVTVVTAANHGFGDGDTITINGAVPTDYNGSHVIAYVSPTSFTYTTTTALPPQTGTGMTASSGVSNTAMAVVASHGFSTNEQVTISGATPNDYNGSYLITKVDNDTFTYTLISTPASATGTITARLTTVTAFATLTGHGYSTGNSIIISGATPAAYNGTFSITVLDADHFKYGPLTSSPQQSATGTLIAAKNSITARATAVSHGFIDGSDVTIAGASPEDFNGTFVDIVKVDDDHFTYTLTSAQGVASGGNITAEEAGVGVTDTARDNLINWVRGEDNFEDENQNTSSTDVRASIHGDVLHSKPAVINYNRLGTDNDVMVFYGANDGVFRAIKGGFDSVEGYPDPGQEVWGFIPSELLGTLKRLRNNDPIISSANKKRYFMDGNIGVYVKDANDDGTLEADDEDKVYLYIGMRRGGRLIYALDVSTPDAPKLLWKKDQTSLGYTELGYTWSEPKVITSLNANGGDPVLIFGAGFDPNVEDVPPDSITVVSATDVTAGAAVYTRSMGRGIFVVDATTGDVLWQAGPGRDPADTATHPYFTVDGMNYSIPSDVTVIANNGGSVRNRAYVGDTGGNLWRVNMDDADVNNWTVTKLAFISDLTTIPGGLRKFLYPPDVVYTDTYDAVLIGSGDREHPLDVSVANRMYMFKDVNTGVTSEDLDLVEDDLYDATTNCIQDSTACVGEDTTTAQINLDDSSGWYIKLLEGEKLVGNAITLNGATFFNTHQPASVAEVTSCVNSLGVARAYQVMYLNAFAVKDQNSDSQTTSADRFQVHAGGGFLPPPTPVVVQIDGKTLQGVVSGVRVDDPPGITFGTRYRRFWFKEVE